jgi:hypothetical protein
MKYSLLYELLYESLTVRSARDEAALRSLKRKYEELQDDVQLSSEQAQAQLIQEYDDCLPVDA